MLLRASGQTEGKEVDIHAITDADADSGVPHGSALTAFAEATVLGSADEVARTRDVVALEMGAEAVVDAAAVAANFQRMVRIADSTGIPLDKPVAIFSVDLREDLGLDAWSASANTPRVGAAMRTVGRVAQPLVAYIMKLYGSKQTRS
jgi:hypothetical protein